MMSAAMTFTLAPAAAFTLLAFSTNGGGIKDLLDLGWKEGDIRFRGYAQDIINY